MRRVLAITLAIGAFAASPISPADAQTKCRANGSACSGGGGAGGPGGGGGSGGTQNFEKGTASGGGGGRFGGGKGSGGGFKCDSNGCATHGSAYR